MTQNYHNIGVLKRVFCPNGSVPEKNMNKLKTDKVPWDLILQNRGSKNHLGGCKTGVVRKGG